MTAKIADITSSNTGWWKGRERERERERERQRERERAAHTPLSLSLLTVLDSEVVDLRVCLQSADRELAELKADLKKEKKSHDHRSMELMRRVSLI